MLSSSVFAQESIYQLSANPNQDGYRLSLLKSSEQLDEIRRIQVAVPEQGIQAFSAVKRYVTAKNQQIWLGEGKDHSSVSFIKSKHGLSGSIRSKQGTWLIRPDKQGNSTVTKFDKSQYQKVTDVVLPSEKNNHKNQDNLINGNENGAVESSPSAYNSTNFQHIQTSAPTGFSDVNDIRILVYYSSSALKNYPNIEDLIELDFADANQALVNSNIDATYTLAGFIEISDRGTENNLYDMLDRVNNYERLDEMKEKYDADLVHFFGGNLGWVCGIAYYSADSTGWVDPRSGVGATEASCTGTLTFAHEVGHNLGARHDRYVEDGGTSDYAYGYVDLENEFRTLMSYTNNCNDNGKSCTEITHYSNPEVTYNGFDTGIVSTDAEAANNSSLLTKTTQLAANYTGVGYPANFQVSKGSISGQVTLTWDALAGADGYEVKRSQLFEQCPKFTDVYSVYDTTSETSITINSIATDQFCYWVRAYKDYAHGARMYSAPTLVETGYASEFNTHISDITPQHITTQNGELALDFSTNKSVSVSASIYDSNASDWLAVTVENISGNNYQLKLVNTAEISASAIIILQAGDTKEYVPVQFSGYTNALPVIDTVQSVDIPQGGTETIELSVTDDGGADNIRINYYSEDTNFIKNSALSFDNGKLTIAPEHELIGTANIVVTAFDGELQSSKKIKINIVRGIYNSPHIPEEITLYVDGDKSLTRLLPGYSIDDDEIAHQISIEPEHGSLVLQDGSFTYTPTTFVSEDSFTLQSQLVANGDENMPQDVYTTRVNIRPLSQTITHYQQYIFGSEYSRFLLTHRGKLWHWGRKYNEQGVAEYFESPTLLLDGDWVDAAYLLYQESIVLLKADGTLWMVGRENFYDPEATTTQQYFWQPRQIGNDQDWQAIFEDSGSSFSGGVLLTKTDGSLWGIGESWPLFGDDNFDTYNEPFQVNALYNWKSGAKIRETFSLLDSDGVVWTAGDGRFESLGRKETKGLMGPVSLPEPVTRIEGGLWRNFAYTDNGLYAWGTHIFLQNGNPDYVAPVLINITNWAESSFSTYSFSGVTGLGQLYTASAQPGAVNGRGESAPSNLLIVGDEFDWVSSHSVRNATYAIKDNGTLWVAGSSSSDSQYTLGISEELGAEYFEFTQLNNFPEDTLGTNDTDGDGILNFKDIDDDNDCIIDTLDDEPDVALEGASACLDTDGDGLVDSIDEDDDNDGVVDTSDAFPLDASEWLDTDNDGIGNNADTDDDNDNVLDVNDAFPLDASESVDTDSDGIGNNADTDDDNDNVLDVDDAFPLDASESVDTDSDGIGNNADTDDDNDGVLDANDAFPLDASESVDTDSDGIGNNADTDDDNDGVQDANDAFPLDASESVDTDSDGIGNNADTDDDNDGVLDANDAFPLDSTRSVAVSTGSSDSSSSSGGGSFGLFLMLLAVVTNYRRTSKVRIK